MFSANPSISPTGLKPLNVAKRRGNEVGLRGNGIGLGGLDWRVGRGRTKSFHVQKKIKHFSFRNYTKILLNLVNFS